MFKTKKEVDLHVRTALAKLRSETEKNLRSFTIAKLYYKINEYSTAEQYVSSYLTIKDDNDQAHKLLGQCYQRQKKSDKALASFQRSLQLNPKQPDLLAEVCQLLMDDKALNTNKAKYWCDLAESEKVQHDAVFSLRLKLMNKDNLETSQVEQLIQKEISSRPQDVNLRVRLVRHFVEQNKILEAFQNTCQLEMINHNMLAQSAEWYNVVWLVLSKYEQMPNTKKDWQFWLLLITCLERQVNISFTATKNLPNGGTTETANLLFNFDQYLHKVSQISDTLHQQKELVARFMDHYQGQLCLHAASLIFKRELIQNKNKWKETIKTVLPLLLMSYQSDSPDAKEPWMKHCDEHGKLLLQLWCREGAFRCAQAGRTLLACIEVNNENTNQLNNILGSQSPWTTPEALISQIRQSCSDKNWRRSIFGQLFYNSDQKVKEQTSFLIKSAKLSEPTYELPTYAEVEQHEETAQYLNPQSLQYMVYLCLGNDNLAYVRSKFFNGLNFSTQNLSFCGAESLNQLDVETFLYAATLQAKRLLDVDRKSYDNYHAGTMAKPKILPFVNIQYSLCTEEQMNWWTSAYQVYKNLASDNLAEIRANLQYGIEAIRGINGPKVDMIIVFKLGKIFEARAQDVLKPVEKALLEARSENLYKYGLNMLKMSNKGVLEPFKRYFKYANANNSAVEREVSVLAEDAVSYLASRYFKKSEYEELIEELSGIQLPFATYLQSEAYRKLDEANKTPKKAKRMYLDKASDCLNQTLQLLKSTHVDPNHPLNSVIHSELKRLQQTTSKFVNDHAHGNNSSTYEDAETEFGIGDSSPLYNGNNRSRREVSIVSPRTIELENIVKQIASMLSFVKEELIENIKPEVVGLKKEVNHLKEKLAIIEENMRKKSNPPSRDDASNVLDDLYIIDDELQNQMYSNQQQQQQQQQMQHLYGYPPQHSMGQRMHTPTAVNPGTLPVPPGGVNPYNSPLYGNYALNYYAQQFMMPPQQGAAPVMGGHVSQLGNRNPMNLPYVDSSVNFNAQGINAGSLVPPVSTDNRSSSLFGLLTQNTPQQQPLGAPIQQQQLAPTQPSLPSTSIQSVTMPQKPQITQQPNPQTVLPAITVPPPNAPITFNKSLNNMPVEKGPPVNVVITSSDPLPIISSGVQTQPTLSVTIPPHHIKPNLFAPSDQQGAPPCTNFPMTAAPMTSTSTSPFTMKFPSPAVTTTTTIVNTSTFSFKPPPQTKPDESLNKTNDSNSSDLHKSEAEIEYDPRPDFKPIIPLPDEVEVKTGEENEEVMFCSRSKLFRFVDKEWKERGVGDIKILKNKDDGISRILMRRDQTHKICANHRITSELNLTKPKNGEKGFIWAANDFADEKLQLEKFLVRFKHVETAEQFQAAFNVARKEAKEAPKPTNGEVTNKPPVFGFGLKTFANDKTSTPAGKPEKAPDSSAATTVSKTLFGGLAPKNSNESKQQTASPFANFSFDKTTSNSGGEAKPFANIFSSMNNIQSAEPSPIGLNTPKATNDSQADTAKSDNEDEYVPTAQFQPVIPLPDLVEVTTGEENESVLFEHRAKLLRFDKTTSEWKERGLGNIKILQDKNDVNKVRLVMRREIIHKLCCNQRLYKDTSFKYSKNSKNALMWAGQDYSENELQVEMLTIRFKTAEICSQFLDAIHQAQAKMSAEANEENAKTEAQAPPADKAPAATVEEKGFGDKFKPKAGSWSCKDCYTSNTADKQYCASCEAPKDDTVPKKESSIFASAGLTAPKSTFSFGFGGAAATKAFVATEAAESAKQQTQTSIFGSNATSPVVGFGDKFKPKEGSWSCEKCYTSNTADKLQCIACEAPKNSEEPKKETITSFLASSTASKPDFTFGFGATPKPASTTQPALVQLPEKTPAPIGFGDKFKPKEGSWDCSACYLSNSGDKLYCKACDAPKDDTVPKKEPENILALSNPSQKFSFGFAAAGNTVPKTEASSFNFGASTSSTTSTTAGSFTFGIPKGGDTGSKTTNFFGESGTLNSSSSKLGGDATKSFTFAPAVSVAADSTTSTVGGLSKSPFSFSLASKTTEAPSDKGGLGSAFSLDKKDFNFVLKPKSPGKTKSPQKVPHSPGGAEEDEDEETADEEENNTYFTPVIPLPEKIEVKTGEEDEELMYSHRAKLYRFTDGEWKERGLGDVKILRHKETKKLRVVMRRDQVLKICLNHVLNEDVKYKNKDDKSWLFAVYDYSEGEVETHKFCLRFKNKEVADDFMKAVNDCIEGKGEPITEAAVDASKSDISISAAEVNKEIKISDENKKIADKLLLPYSFFDVESVTCPGCRGCDPDAFVFPEYPSVEEPQDPLPLDLKGVLISNPIRSILKPSKLIEDITPTKPTAPAAPLSTSNSIFGGTGTANSTTSQANSTSAMTFSFTQALNSTAKPEDKPAGGNFLFGGASGPTLFGGGASADKSIFGKPSIFGGATTTDAAESTDKSKSVFGGTGAPLFGGAAKTDYSKPVFGSSTIFGGQAGTDSSSKFIFGGSTFGSKPAEGTTPSIFGALTVSKDSTPQGGFLGKTMFGDTDSDLSFGALAKQSEAAKTEGSPSVFGTAAVPKDTSSQGAFLGKPLFGETDSELSFGALAKQQPIAKVASPSDYIGLTHSDAFSSFKNTSSTKENSEQNESVENESAADYDPHYEPIIPLPAEISLSTGEEDETKLFGDRATLYRYDQVNKEWKERGVGEIKILQHKSKGTYRLIMRREQIHKLVLNHGVGADFTFNAMGSNQRSFIWATMNFAEEPAAVEKLSVRFRSLDSATKFKDTLTNCIEAAKSRAELEPEED